MDVDNASHTESPDREPENMKGTVPTQNMTVPSKRVSSCLSCADKITGLTGTGRPVENL